MNKSLFAQLLIWSSLLAGWQSSAGDAPLADRFTEPSTQSPDRYSASLRMGFNITADFKNLGSFPAQGHLVPIPGQGLVLEPSSPNGDAAGNLTYEDGYVWKDSSGNALGYSRYWGYDS